jgi:hypothetical protein
MPCEVGGGADSYDSCRGLISPPPVLLELAPVALAPVALAAAALAPAALAPVALAPAALAPAALAPAALAPVPLALAALAPIALAPVALAPAALPCWRRLSISCRRASIRSWRINFSCSRAAAVRCPAAVYPGLGCCVDIIVRASDDCIGPSSVLWAKR